MGMSAAEAQFHVLAVDDSLIDRKLIERLLKTSSYQVTTVDSGSKALEFLGWHECNSNEADLISPRNHNQEVEVNLVITDYCMPGMTGYDLLKKMKESSFLRNIPVVIMSSENVPSRINRCLEEGAEEFFLKPVRISDVKKLEPHMKKAKRENVQIPSKRDDDSKEDDDENDQDNRDGNKLQIPQSQLQIQSQLQQQSPQTNSNYTNNDTNNDSSNNSSSKRKSMDEGLSGDRTRPRYNGLTVMSS